MNDNDVFKIVTDYIKAIEAPLFQDFCDRFLLKLHKDDYTPVRAGGSNGDMKNDGYCYISRKFFHAHASRGETASKIKSKIKSDLEGCLSKQSNVKEFIYLTNDILIGEVQEFVDALREKHKKIIIATWGPKILALKISQLPISAIELIIDRNLTDKIDYGSGVDIEQKDWGIAEEIFDYVNENLPNAQGRFDIATSGKTRSLSGKIKLNFTSEKQQRVKEIIINNWVRKETVEMFVKNQMEIDGNRILALKDKVQADYCKLAKVASTDEPISDFSIFENMAKELLPDNKRTNPDYIANAKSIVLYFFEFCDIGKKTKEELKKKDFFE